MSVVAGHLYRQGRRIGAVSLDQRPAMVDGDFVWIGLYEPSAAEMEALQRTYDLHPLAVEDAHKAHQLPKVDIYGDQLFVIARTAHMEEKDRIAYGETAIFVGRGHIITVRHGSARAHTTLRAQLEAAPMLLAHGTDYVLHAILDFIVDGYLPIIETMEEDVLAMERQALEAILDRDSTMRLFAIRRELIRFRRTLGPMSEVAGRLAHLDLPGLDQDVRPYFQDVLDHVRRVEVMVENLREVLTTVFEVSHLLESQRQGVITRQLAAWAAILAVPTAIAGIYGMNFVNMPELHTRYGYFVVLGVIALISGILYIRFRRAGWL
ncbi:MAG: magnesium/cobalt transporter CorA [Sphingobium sp.]